MLTTRIEASAGNYEKYFAITSMDEATLLQAVMIFNDYCEKGVILSKCFSDDNWTLTDQTRKITLRFRFSETGFYRNTEQWMGCSYRCFCDCVKAYVIFTMGSTGLSSIREIVRCFANLAEKTAEQLLNINSDYVRHMIELLRLLPCGCDTRDIMLEAMEEKISCGWQRGAKRNQRVLADFSTYFAFNDVLEDFWKTADEDAKLFFFPLRFWWSLTAILPLRPTEFLLTPRNCLAHENGEYVLTLRRTVQKGGGKKIAYRIDHDYKLTKYSIPDKMAREIIEYQKATESMTRPILGTLFAQDAHYAQFGRTASYSSIYYTYTNINTCLRRFQNEMMGLPEDSESRIRLGDTRHLAMISLIVSGGSPVICKELAGHEDVNISAHYYSNISRFVECATYEMYRKSKGGIVKMREHRPLNVASETVMIPGGYCDSPAYLKGNIDDCIRYMGSGGELGYCQECPHFIDGGRGRYIVFADPAERKKQVDEDSRSLMQVLEIVRKGVGCSEDIQSALLRLQHSSAWYSRCLQDEWEVNDYGETTKNDD
jgi:hypothetical protein